MSPAAASLQPNTAADLLEQYRLAGGDPDRFIMVGGGAGLHWDFAFAADSSGDSADSAAEETPLRTRDIDFQIEGINDDPEPMATVEAFAAAIGGRAVRPDVEHATPELAHVVVPDYFGPDDPLIVDFLVDIIGLDSRKVAKHAETLLTETSGGDSVEFRVAHPVHVLLGMVENYIRLAARRTDATLARVDRLLPVVRRYIVRTATSATDPGMDRETARHLECDARWSMQTLLRKCATQRYARFTLETGRDLLVAIPGQADAPVKSEFWDEEYPRRLQAVDQCRGRIKKRTTK